MAGKATMEIGERFHRLLVVGLIPDAKNPKALCRCDCGEITAPQRGALRSGKAKSCGCLKREAAAKPPTGWPAGAPHWNATHGMSRTPTYISWIDARKRCFRQKDQSYPRYGGRGITMCQRWRESFSAFLADMGPAGPGMTLDRIDPNGHYEPGNCRWATKEEQARNKRTNVATWEAVRAIRAERLAGLSFRALAAKYRMTEGNVVHIVQNKTWVEK